MNPELLRNLRLEFSVQRLIAMPVILAVIFALIWFTELGENQPSGSIQAP